MTSTEPSESLFGDVPGWVAPAILLLLLAIVITGMIVLNRADNAVEVETIDWTKEAEPVAEAEVVE